MTARFQRSVAAARGDEHLRPGAALTARFGRVLKPGGRFATFDVVLNSGEPHYPLPWARNAGDELSLNSRRDARGRSNRPVSATLAFARRHGRPAQGLDRQAARIRARLPSPKSRRGDGAGLRAGFPANLGRNLMEGRLGILSAVFEAASTNT